MDATGWPTRDEVRARWHGILEGSLTREDVHVWTIPWVEGVGPPGPTEDMMAASALQYLHGFTMASDPATPTLVHHGPPGVYVKSLGDIRADLERWEQRCREYDSDPVGYLANCREQAEAHVHEQRRA